MNVIVKRVLFGNEHDDQKWIVLEGSIEGCAPVTKRVTIAASAYVADRSILETHRTKLIADVTEYHANWLALQSIDG